MEEEKKETEEKQESKLLKAKTLSLIAKVLAVAIVLGGHILKWLNVLPNASSSEICMCALTVMGIFGTVDLNILVDKFTKKE